MYAKTGSLQKLTEAQTISFLSSEGYTKTKQSKSLIGSYTNGGKFAIISKSCKRGFYLVSRGLSF